MAGKFCESRNLARKSEKYSSVSSLNPVSQEKIGVSSATVVPVTAEYEFFSIRGKHRKGIEHTLAGYSFQTAPVSVDHIQLKIIAFLAVMVAGKYDFISGWMKERCPVGLAKAGDFLQVTSIGFAGINFHVGRSNKVIFQ
jgi:hypothetical protein